MLYINIELRCTPETNKMAYTNFTSIIKKYILPVLYKVVKIIGDSQINNYISSEVLMYIKRVQKLYSQTKRSLDYILYKPTALSNNGREIDICLLPLLFTGGCSNILVN